MASSGTSYSSASLNAFRDAFSFMDRTKSIEEPEIEEGEEIDLPDLDNNHPRSQDRFKVVENERVSEHSSEVRDIHWAASRLGYKHDSTNLNQRHDEAVRSLQGKKGFFSRKVGADVYSAHSTRAYFSFMDTTLGGNFPINTAYRFTRTADINMDRMYDKIGAGMGRYYYERIEENAHDIHLRFGVQKFNSGLSFFTSWFDYYSYSIATHGRAPSFLYEMGQVAGIAMGFMAPGVWAVGFLIKMFNLLGGGKFWYVSPTMPVYWTVVNNLLNEITGAMGLTLPPSNMDAVDIKMPGGTASMTGSSERNMINQLKNILPGVYQDAWGSSEEGFSIDVRRIASRAQKLENQLNRAMMKKLTKISPESTATERYYEIMNTYAETLDSITDGNGKLIPAYQVEYKSKQNGINKQSTRAYLHEFLNSKAGKSDAEVKATGNDLKENNGDEAGSEAKARQERINAFGGVEDDSMQTIYDNGGQKWDDVINNLAEQDEDDNDFFQLIKKELNDGSAFLTLRVDGTKSIGESFSNSSEESMLSSTINGWAQTKKQFVFNLAGGSIAGDLVGKAVGGITDLMAGTFSTFNVNGLMGFLMGSKIDIPKTHGSSSTSFPSTSYTLKLRTPYNHPICIVQDLYFPLCCILAAALPLAHGRVASGSPFYCELYDRGRAIVKNGIISSVSVERATSGVPWTKEGLPLGLDITFTVENLESTMSLPVSTGSLGELISPGQMIEKILNGNESPLQDYVSVLAGLSLNDIIYRGNNIKRNLFQWRRQWNSFWDKDHWAQKVGSMAPVKWISLFAEGTQRR